MFKHIIQPTVSDKGFEASRADHLSKPGMITNQVLQRIVDDELVIADLTGHNPNVFYELAIRHAVGKPLIQIMQDGENLPFDIAQSRTIFFDYRDLDSVASAKLEIGKQLDAILKDEFVVESPLSASIDITKLQQSSSPQDRTLSELLKMMSDVRTSVANLQHEVNMASSGRRLNIAETNPGIFKTSRSAKWLNDELARRLIAVKIDKNPASISEMLNAIEREAEKEE